MPQFIGESISQPITRTCEFVIDQVSSEISDYIDQYGINLDKCLSSNQSSLGMLNGHQLASKSNALFSRVARPRPFIRSEEEEKIDVCIEEEAYKYLNRKDVQEARHAKLVGVPSWILCSRIQTLDSGDQDSVTPLIGSRRLVHKLADALGLNATMPYRPWFDQRQQVGGWSRVYGALSFATIRGAPYSSTERSLDLFQLS